MLVNNSIYRKDFHVLFLFLRNPLRLSLLLQYMEFRTNIVIIVLLLESS